MLWLNHWSLNYFLHFRISCSYLLRHIIGKIAPIFLFYISVLFLHEWQYIFIRYNKAYNSYELYVAFFILRCDYFFYL